MSTFNEQFRELAKKRVDERLAPLEQAILSGLLDYDEYKRQCGMRFGLLEAKEEIDHAFKDAMRS